MDSLSSTEIQFIQNHLADDVRQLLLRAHPKNLDVRKLVAQIAARQKVRDKLPTWYANDTLLFPTSLSVEQASSEQTARYKASLVAGKLLFDLTGGMGVDTWAFSQRVDHVIYTEQQPELAELATHNLPLLGATNVAVYTGNGLDILANYPNTADWVYLDPHRRNEQGGKVVRLEECEPDVTQAGTLSVLQQKAQRILVKASPLLDIDSTVRQLTTVQTVHIVAVQGEVKEVLLAMEKQALQADEVLIKAVNLTATEPEFFQFLRREERMATVSLSDPQRYLYEPNAAVLKAGAFRLIATRFGLSKLAPNSHLYTSNRLVTGFPGRTFTVEHICKPDRKSLQLLLPARKANLTVRNFPQSVADLRKKLALQEGGDVYILATTLQNGDKRLIITQKTIH
ncbi:SAM-dependent methyltransferase [Spirosoma sp. SC4-14]|uniref:THUMP-like domain-containing protein n=1 Tax=Spirosoma sp. SC4-14 TaxID=3128900 RepID=UPI0030CCC9FB